MGRSAYTPNTQRTLAKLAQTLPGRSVTSKTAEASLVAGHASTSTSPVSVAAQSTSPPSSRKDVLPWRHQAFDPDDESLPIVTERFIESESETMLEIEEEVITQQFLTDDTESASITRTIASSSADNHYDNDVVQHGNGGYHDAAPRVRTTIVTADEAFSPSAAVFHQHTLPLQLPAPGEMHRRHNTAQAYPTSRQITQNATPATSTPFMF